MTPALSPALITRVGELVLTGITPVRAARSLGVDGATFDAWMAEGAEDERRSSRPARFREAILTAEAECEATLVSHVQAAAEKGDWRSASWMLERRFGWRRRSVNDSRSPDDDGSSERDDQFADL